MLLHFGGFDHVSQISIIANHEIWFLLHAHMYESNTLHYIARFNNSVISNRIFAHVGCTNYKPHKIVGWFYKL
jgi:hypothetical protein